MKRGMKKLVGVLCIVGILTGCAQVGGRQNAAELFTKVEDGLCYLRPEFLHAQTNYAQMLELAIDADIVGVYDNKVLYTLLSYAEPGSYKWKISLHQFDFLTGEQEDSEDYWYAYGVFSGPGFYLPSRNLVVAPELDETLKVPFGKRVLMATDLLSGQMEPAYFDGWHLCGDIADDKDGTVYFLEREEGERYKGSRRKDHEINWRVWQETEGSQPHMFFNSIRKGYSDYLAFAVAACGNEVYVLAYDVAIPGDIGPFTKCNPYLLVIDKSSRELTNCIPVMHEYEENEKTNAYPFASLMVVGEKFMNISWTEARGSGEELCTSFRLQRDENGRLVGLEMMPIQQIDDAIISTSSHQVAETLIADRYIFVQHLRGTDPSYLIYNNLAPNLQVLDNETGKSAMLRIPDFTQSETEWPYYLYANAEGDLVAAPGTMAWPDRFRSRPHHTDQGMPHPENDVWYYIQKEDLLPCIEAALEIAEG